MGVRLKDSTVLVTGASSGIGRCLALQLAPHAHTLVLVARRLDRLEQLKSQLLQSHPALTVELRRADLADLAATKDLVASLSPLRPVDVLINSAGVGHLGTFDHADWERIHAMVQVNTTGLMYLTHALLPGMIARGHGGILNISSGFGLTVAPGMAAYVASKYFVTALTECIRMELSGTGVTITQVCPGPVTTEFEANTGNFTGVDVPGFLQISPERCARVALRALTRGRALVVPGWFMAWLLPLAGRAPRWLLRAFWWLPAKALRNKQRAMSAPSAG